MDIHLLGKNRATVGPGSHWTRVWIPIGAGLFIAALAGSAVVVPQLRLLHVFQALIYGSSPPRTSDEIAIVPGMKHRRVRYVGARQQVLTGYRELRNAISPCGPAA